MWGEACRWLAQTRSAIPWGGGFTALSRLRVASVACRQIRGLQRHVHRKAAARTQRRCGGNTTTEYMRDQTVHDGKTQTRAALAQTRGEERVKDPCQVLGRNTYASIVAFDVDRVFAYRPRTQVNAAFSAPGESVGHGVFHQAADHMLEWVGVVISCSEETRSASLT